MDTEAGKSAPCAWRLAFKILGRRTRPPSRVRREPSVVPAIPVPSGTVQAARWGSPEGLVWSARGTRAGGGGAGAVPRPRRWSTTSPRGRHDAPTAAARHVHADGQGAAGSLSRSSGVATQRTKWDCDKGGASCEPEATQVLRQKETNGGSPGLLLPRDRPATC